MADLFHVLPLQSVSDEAQEALSKIEYLEGDSATKVKEYDGVVRSLWEVNQLYEQFRWKYGELRRLVPCDRFDFLPDGFTSGGFGERTVVNAAFGNYVSAARGLVDRMQAVMRDYDRGSVKELYKTIGSCLLLGMTEVASMFLCMRYEIPFSMVKPLFRLLGKTV